MRLSNRIAFALLIIGLSGCGGHDNHANGHHGGVDIRDGYVRVPPRAGTVAAGYFTVTNHGSEAVELTAVSSADFSEVQMHETVMTDGMMAMNELPVVTIAKGATVEFKPGGNHLMLFGAAEPIAVDKRYDFTFVIERAGEVEQHSVTFEALPFGQSPGGTSGHDGMQH